MEMLLVFLALLAVAGAVAAFVIVTYNALVRLRIEAEEGWSGVDVQLKRRADLVPSLVNVVKGSAGHERQTLEAVTAARAGTMAAQTPAQRAAAEARLSQALANLYMVAEAYPELKASVNFTSLQEELSGIEDTLQSARRYYNATVRDLNIKVDSFPTNLVARAFRFVRKEFFELDGPGDRAAPVVQF
jgi:LemA protein